MLGTLEIYDNQEPVDAIFAFLQPMRTSSSTVAFEFMLRQLLQVVCQPAIATCTRTIPRLFHHPIVVADPVGPLQVFEGDEPADRVFELANRFNLSSVVRDQILNTVCVDIKAAINVTCTRFAPVVFQIPITKNASEPPVGMLQILQGSSMLSHYAIFRFGHEHDLSPEAQASMLPGVCEASQLPCTRTRSLRHIAVRDQLGIPFFADDEPADVVYWYGTSRNWTLMERKQWLAELCQIQRAGEPLLNCTRAEARLFHLPVMETADKEIGTLEVLEDQEPIDQVYAFLEKHDLFQTAPVNESLANITCQHVPCTRLRPRRILFTMQATYLGLKHSIQLVQPEEDWVCAESFGSKKCQHYVQVKCIEYCAKHMPSWAECEGTFVLKNASVDRACVPLDVMGNALRQHLTYYEEDLWKKPNGKDLYAKLGLVKGATSDEIEAAYHALVLRFNNETEPQKYEKLRAAYDTLHDPVKKYYYDLPCLKFFGLCGKRQADGGISISMDN
ncbi:hypothetical protein DYB32_003742 [Aphanomyces invadans]|uniref:J domain-containing protein n=1 Tax=Aphanomyces invadans TaxID=157072 RepID=A0A3R6YAR5_9STRA|nr:hypothetical protein DYB32_003742 [Aphanomyces invadans]